MDTFELNGTTRTEIGKKYAKRLRREKIVPAILYGGKENILFSLQESDLRNLIYTPNVYLVNLSIGKKKHKAVIKEIQFHPVTDKVLHIDFFEIFDDKKIVVAIPVKLVGSAIGVKQGGKLTLVKRKLRVYGLPKDLPNSIEIDVTSMDIGTSKYIEDIALENIELVDPKSTVIATLKLTRISKGMQEGSEEVAGVEGADAEAAASSEGEENVEGQK